MLKTKVVIFNIVQLISVILKNDFSKFSFATENFFLVSHDAIANFPNVAPTDVLAPFLLLLSFMGPTVSGVGHLS